MIWFMTRNYNSLPTVKNIDDVDLNEALTRSCLRSEIGKLCKDLIHLLEWGTEVEKTSLVEKCCILYNIILNIKFTGNCLCIYLV